jgi:hypothetical protein
VSESSSDSKSSFSDSWTCSSSSLVVSSVEDSLLYTSLAGIPSSNFFLIETVIDYINRVD